MACSDVRYEWAESTSPPPGCRCVGTRAGKTVGNVGHRLLPMPIVPDYELLKRIGHEFFRSA